MKSQQEMEAWAAEMEEVEKNKEKLGRWIQSHQNAQERPLTKEQQASKQLHANDELYKKIKLRQSHQQFLKSEAKLSRKAHVVKSGTLRGEHGSEITLPVDVQVEIQCKDFKGTFVEKVMKTGVFKYTFVYIHVYAGNEIKEGWFRKDKLFVHT
jgi:hypothetical protein